MKNSEEMMNDLIERREKYNAEQTLKRRTAMKIAVPVLSLCMVALIGFGVWQSGITGHVASDPDHGSAGTPGGSLPESNVITHTGEKITDAEAKEYFDTYYSAIASTLKACGVPSDKLTISEKGYCHVKSNQEGLEVSDDFRDYLAYNDDELVSVITLTKSNGIISYNPAFGSASYDDFEKLLHDYEGQTLIFIYADYVNDDSTVDLVIEMILTPDGKCFDMSGNDITEEMQWLINPYEWYYDESAAYTP